MKKEVTKGFDVKITYKKGSAYYRVGSETDTFHNVTEIHYNFKSLLDLPRVAFESDIHGTGHNVPIDEIQEFEAVLAEKISDSF